MEKTLINPMRKLSDEERVRPQPMPPERTPEERIYVILAVFKNDSREQTFRMCLGRSEAAEEGRLLVLDNADLDESRVFMDHQTIKDAISLYWFMVRCEQVGAITDKEFHIDDYMEGDPVETFEEANIREQIPEQIVSTYQGDIDMSTERDV